jgi:hypothetical protein
MQFFLSRKIFYCEPTNANGELKKRSMSGFSPRLRQNNKILESHSPPNLFFFLILKNLFLALFGNFFICNICNLEELLNASGLRIKK